MTDYETIYDLSGTAHVVGPDAEVWTDENLLEKLPAVCGANFPAPKSRLSAVGLRLAEEWIKGELCVSCAQNLASDEATIPGFMVDGELVGEALRTGGPIE